MKSFISKGLDEFCTQYANWGSKKTVCITFDIDFAPDYMIQNILQLLKKFEITATFFTTHESPLLKTISELQEFEIGIHPNLSQNSTQGYDLKEIIDNLKTSFPDSIGNRFHLLKYSYRDLRELGRMGFQYDVSTVRFNCPYLLPVFHNDINMMLLTYSWEDGLCENAGLPMNLNSIDIDSPGIKILNFHPMNTFINSPNEEIRVNFLSENPDLPKCSEDTAKKYIYSGDGAGSLLISLLKFLKKNNYYTLRLKDLSSSFMNYTK